MNKSNPSELARVRLDKWLWAARFYKTRGVAKQAIDGGKVHIEGTRTKPSKEIEVGAVIKLRQGVDEKTVTVIALSEHRRGAPEAQLLYDETEESIEKREKLAIQRKSQPTFLQASGKPNKKDRRLIHRFKQRE
ncbi:MAG: ribosome-associated heat shock protein Hsp15 [Gammaproteobacteria bacterium]|jgi:ribosome-associated heat shock protein Hsp15|nr:ribosome-associated heat shock protein Hsp15 [Gammaproteobacteria bacterium]MBT3858576.1 ribosome-associated heat shock protein Hsp15 [Gammaproteobacteria bacterium]MBT3986686.1 ribosome-associated heat shock protein Hsp15 [Gammaproteobacteria bacterium]MBT4257026.1 ribosome-associated heat shock protein Hsp15 [Gammaproteobacteria bacterium]MBT4582782.1 ribosome-associated heat shock protein Hsp15 [Gammaproteobacteria bacterium]